VKEGKRGKGEEGWGFKPDLDSFEDVRSARTITRLVVDKHPQALLLEPVLLQGDPLSLSSDLFEHRDVVFCQVSQCSDPWFLDDRLEVLSVSGEHDRRSPD
jgi:hypothetical protein